ncbi:hypothetical protein TELCIR_05595 [Teladorsagia circumcincta]|uniref:Uncharacterized protein n=1 Tax=Teladorsagia circumcincta TaxID=45464 RepID=A0A2G9UQE9_TELCI|nr:hypothetical protein TELCIR_05595 [Teladorsagia circumcincta]
MSVLQNLDKALLSKGKWPTAFVLCRDSEELKLFFYVVLLCTRPPALEVVFFRYNVLVLFARPPPTSANHITPLFDIIVIAHVICLIANVIELVK